MHVREAVNVIIIFKLYYIIILDYINIFSLVKFVFFLLPYLISRDGVQVNHSQVKDGFNF